MDVIKGELQLDKDIQGPHRNIHITSTGSWCDFTTYNSRMEWSVFAGMSRAPAGLTAFWTLMAIVLLMNVQVPAVSAGSIPASVTGFYTDNSAQQSVVLDHTISPKQKKDIRNEILRMLGLDHRPDVRGSRLDSSSIPQYMLELYRALGDGGGPGSAGGGPSGFPGPHNLTIPDMEAKLGKADLIMGFVNQAGLQHRHQKHQPQLFSDGGRRFYFDFSGVKSTEGVTGAELRIYKYSTAWLADRGPLNVKLFKITNDQFRQESVLELASSQAVHALAEGWLDVNATEAVGHWFLEPEEEVVMYLEVTDKYGVDMEPSTAGLVDNSGPKDKQAFLLACFKATHKLNVRKSRALHNTRMRRSAPPSGNYYSDEKDYGWRHPPDHPSRRACQRRQLYVSFLALGWQDWVIAPKGYPAFYCEGECVFPLDIHMNATNHAIVQSLVHIVKPFLAPNPCCAPTTLNGLSFLYLDNSYNVVLKQYKNMVVQACGCQ